MESEDIYIPDVPEDRELIIFLGRPNAGKSSWINIVFGIKRVKGKMAGSTKKIAVLNVPNHPKLNIVDVPGWGRVAGKSRQFAVNIKDQIMAFMDRNAGHTDIMGGNFPKGSPQTLKLKVGRSQPSLILICLPLLQTCGTEKNWV